MKNVILGLLLLGFISTGQSQILLKEAKVVAKPSMKIDAVQNSLVVQIPEMVAGEFEKDPILFVRNNFDAAQLAYDNRDTKCDGYAVDFKSRKGHILARFDEKGEIVSTSQKFKNVVLPAEARFQINNRYKNCRLLSNVYIAHTKKWDMKKEFYKVKVKDGKKTRRLRIDKASDKITLASR